MSVLGAISQKDKGTGAVLPNLENPPETTGFFQNIGAGFTQAVAGPHSTRNAKAIYESRHFDQIIQALNAEGEQATDMVESPAKVTSPFYHHVDGEQVLPDGRVLIPVKRPFTNPFAEGPSLTRDVNPISNFYLGGDSKEQQQIWDAVGRVRARKSDFLKQYPDQTAIDALALKQRQADQAQAGQVTSRATTAGKVGSFIGGMVGSISSGDPENFAGGWAGAPGKSVARTVLNRAVAGAATNAAAGVVAVPGQATDAEGMGQPMTTGDMVHSVVQNATAGAVLGTFHAVAPHVPEAVASVAGKAFDTVAPHIPDAVRDPIMAASIRAGTVKDRSLLTEFQRMHSPYAAVDTSTPTEKAAAHVVTRDIETQEQSPLQPNAVPAHNNRLSAVAQALGVDLAPPDMPTTAPVQTPTVKGEPTSFVEGINHAEGSTRNPKSTADGYGNFLEKTWLEVAPKVTDTKGLSRDQILQLRHDKTIAGRATDYYAAQNGKYLRIRGLEDSPGNLSLAHFLGAGDAAKVLKADPSTPVESLLKPSVIAANEKVLRGKSADEVIAWAHKRIGAAVDHPPARPDAVSDEGYDPTSPLPYTVEHLKPEELPPTSAQAPTDEPFNHVLSQHLLVWENEKGERSMIDGGKRLAHARSQEDQNVTLPTVVLREKDGVSEEMALLVGKLKNVNLGTVPLEEAAGTLADIPEVAAALRNPQFHREIAAIAQLPYKEFGDVVNGAVDPMKAVGSYQGSLTKTASWVIRNKKTGEVIMETFDHNKVEALNTGKYEAVPIGEYLGSINGKVDKTATARLEEPTNGTTTLERGKAAGGGNGKPPRGKGRDFASEAPDANIPHGSEPSLVDRALAARDAAEPFSDPVSPEAKQQADLLEHDLRADAGMPREAGGPVVAYHGTHAAFDRFALGHEGEGVSGAARNGFFFSSDFMEARGYAEGTAPGGRVVTAHLALERPLDLRHENHGINHVIKQDEEVARLIEAARAASADGLILRNVGSRVGHDLYVAFDPKKISVVGESPPGATAPMQPTDNPVHLFDLPQTGFRISEEGEPVSLKQAITEAESDEAAAKALRDCL